MVSAESFADDEEAKKSANRLATLFDTYGSDKSNIHNHHYIYGAILKQK